MSRSPENIDWLSLDSKFSLNMKKRKNKTKTYLSLAMDEFLDMDFGDISKSESDL